MVRFTKNLCLCAITVPMCPCLLPDLANLIRMKLEYFITQCINDAPFSVTHEDGLNAMRVAIAGGEAVCPKEEAKKIR